MGPTVGFALLLSTLAGLATVLGSLLGILVHRPGPRFMALTLGFSGGVMILLPHRPKSDSSPPCVHVPRSRLDRLFPRKRCSNSSDSSSNASPLAPVPTAAPRYSISRWNNWKRNSADDRNEESTSTGFDWLHREQHRPSLSSGRL